LKKLVIALLLLLALPVVASPRFAPKPAKSPLQTKDVCWQWASCLHYCTQKWSRCRWSPVGSEEACGALYDVCAERCGEPGGGGCPQPT
jgi:hypothetical protein